MLATVAAAACAMGAVMQPQPGLGDAHIVMGRDTGRCTCEWAIPGIRC
ncbi:hypothetical protein BZL29_0085 [Mycobacterium kansasii]|uniref:Uncharacterized protein n=1 Tax=Mycobacterium kansasii TaxID=1768 RepID=A0A1V3XVT7_MYCKA|nr:hypothetical protein BZL29_0085 [Mycobacterium kansasii]